MDYKKHYELLISRAKNRHLLEYSEKHHIIPRCMGGDDSSDNIAVLTPEEHYLAHQLLVKIYPKNIALVNAAVMMVANRPGNKLYGWLRRKLSHQAKQRIGPKNGRFGLFWASNLETKVSKVVDELPAGWVLGRNKWKIKKRKPKSLRPKHKISDQELAQALRETGSITSGLSKCGYLPQGSNYKRAYRVIKEYDIDIKKGTASV